MKKSLITLMAVIFVLVLALPALAAFNGMIPETGPHWQVNFIGVDNPKTVNMTDTKRRTVFVPLSGNCQINYTWIPGDLTFQVVDGNAFDKNGATIQVPADSTLYDNPDQDVSNLLSYNVYAVALGKPLGGAVITAHCTYDETVLDPNNNKITCDESLLMGSFSLKRTGGKPDTQQVQDITKIFLASGCFDKNDNGVCDTGDYKFSNMWIFNIPFLEDYYWSYDNNGLKLMQVRFYQTTGGTWEVVK